MLRALDLFSGIGGISVALADYARTIGYVEIDKYAQSVLLSRMFSRDIETAPIHRDITRLDGTKLCGSIDLICGGFPCQDLSVAGNGKGLAGERSGLFFEIVRLVKEISPRFVFLENVPAIRTRGLSEVVNAFTEIGYDCRWTCLSAASIGALHKRERWFLLAHANGFGSSSQSVGNARELAEKSVGKKETWNQSSVCPSPCGTDVAYSKRKRFMQGAGKALRSEKQEAIGQDTNDICNQGNTKSEWWSVEPDVGRVVNGLPHRVDRIKCLGNSVVPLQVKTAFERLIGYAPI